MGWAQVSSNRWERALTGFEEYLVLWANKSKNVSHTNQQYTMFSKVKVEINLPNIQSALKHAWKQMRYEEPDIASTFEGDKKVYVIPDEAALQAWLDSTFVVTDITDADEIQRSGGKAEQSRLFYLPQTSELALRMPHYNIDGVGLSIWWDKFFNHLLYPKSESTFGGEHRNLAVPLPEALGNNETPTPEETERATAQVMEYAAKLPGIGMVSKAGKAPSGQCRNIEHRFSPELTRAIIQACKEKDMSVTSAVHAAYGSVLMKHADSQSNTSRYTTVTTFDLRDYLSESFRKTAVTNSTTTLPFSIDLPVSFSQLAQALSDRYRHGIRSNPQTLENVGTYNNVLIGILKTPQAQAVPVPTDGFVSSLGVVEKHLDRQYGSVVTVKDYKISLDVVLGTDTLHVFSFRDQLRVVHSFNDGYEEPHVIREYLNDIEAVLREELLHEPRV
ncbi:hypothetical protein BJY01DRAFT_209917 [Aspergillus pseudoustus]|uniref:Condensation domain-containing protein n=1 Tax=Aspergillus pseudoustus TaxID=1810923 RepID=A0ABR4KHD1_9EURO